MLLPSSRVPEKLLEAIRSGDCIAFVGAGFAGAAEFPSWSTLLTDLADRAEIDPSLREHVRGLLNLRTAHAYDEAAQAIEDVLTRTGFAKELAARLREAELPAAMENRIRWLRGIPFRAIVTTNFDGLLTGSTPSPGAYRNVLLPEARNPWWKGFFRESAAVDVPLIKLHGDVESPETVVITRSDYRRLLYSNPGYQVFLRAMLANHPCCTSLLVHGRVPKRDPLRGPRPPRLRRRRAGGARHHQRCPRVDRGALPSP